MLGRFLILLCLLALAPLHAWAADARPWAALSPAERAALAPLAQHWDRLQVEQQQRLLGVARRFPGLTPQQRQRLHARLLDWTRLTPEQLHAAHQNLSRIQTLSEADQARIRQRWLDALCHEFDPPAGAARP